MAGWRYIATRALSGEVLDWELPLSGVSFTRELSGAPSLSADVVLDEKPELVTAKHTDGLPILDLWSTAIYAEDPSGTLRFGGLIAQTTATADTFSIECAGYFGWLSRQFYLAHRHFYAGGDWSDPVGALGVPSEGGGVVRTLIEHAQSGPDADMGIVVDGVTSSPLRVGTDEEVVEYTPWEHPNIGEAIATLANEEPGFDFIESHEWADATSNSIRHRLTLYYPRAGRRRNDLTFASGINIAADEPDVGNGDLFANYVVADGAGEGSKALREVYPSRDGRPRVMAVEDATSMTSRKQLRKFARRRATARRATREIPAVRVIDHPNAPLGSWAIGDDVPVTLRTVVGDVTRWCRIVSDKWTPEEANVAEITLEPAESFQYGGS